MGVKYTLKHTVGPDCSSRSWCHVPICCFLHFHGTIWHGEASTFCCVAHTDCGENCQLGQAQTADGTDSYWLLRPVPWPPHQGARKLIHVWPYNLVLLTCAAQHTHDATQAQGRHAARTGDLVKCKPVAKQLHSGIQWPAGYPGCLRPVTAVRLALGLRGAQGFAPADSNTTIEQAPTWQTEHIPTTFLPSCCVPHRIMIIPRSATFRHGHRASPSGEVEIERFFSLLV